MKLYVHECISGVIECDDDPHTQDQLQEMMDRGGIELIQKEFDFKITYRDATVEEL